MLTDRCFQRDWIDQQTRTLGARDAQLVEKCIVRAGSVRAVCVQGQPLSNKLLPFRMLFHQRGEGFITCPRPGTQLRILGHQIFESTELQADGDTGAAPVDWTHFPGAPDARNTALVYSQSSR